MSADPQHYVGSELTLFASANTWKRYWSSKLKPYIGSAVVEVGAGIGSNTRFLNDGSASRWVCLEPDVAMSEQLAAARDRGELPPNVTVARGTLDSYSAQYVDTVVYIDVLEHIADDRNEVARAAERLVAGGHLIVLAPAHQWLYSPFDAAIGHHRRYTKSSLTALAGTDLALVDAFYLDSAGLLASSANRFLLHSSMPTEREIAFWDNILVRLSRIGDAVTQHRLGKTIVAVWRRRPLVSG